MGAQVAREDKNKTTVTKHLWDIFFLFCCTFSFLRQRCGRIQCLYCILTSFNVACAYAVNVLPSSFRCTYNSCRASACHAHLHVVMSFLSFFFSFLTRKRQKHLLSEKANILEELGESKRQAVMDKDWMKFTVYAYVPLATATAVRALLVPFFCCITS